MRNTLWLPLITPFKDGNVDFASYDRLVSHYRSIGVDAFFPLGTTGELAPGSQLCHERGERLG